MSDEPDVEEERSKDEGTISAVRFALVVVGGSLISTGAWMAYPPAGWIVAGVLLFSVGMIGALRG